jgi:hypothetical protein
METNGADAAPPPQAVYPAVTIYAVRDVSGQLEPVAAALGGISLPVVAASIDVHPNGGPAGTRAITATLTIPIGGGGIEEVDSPEDVPELSYFAAE